MSSPADDDVTVVSGKPSARVSVERPWEDQCLKLLFQSKQELSNIDISHHVFSLFCSLKDNFGEKIVIYTADNKELLTQNSKWLVLKKGSGDLLARARRKMDEGR